MLQIDLNVDKRLIKKVSIEDFNEALQSLDDNLMESINSIQ